MCFRNLNLVYKLLTQIWLITLLPYFHLLMVGAWLSTSVVGPIMVLLVGFLCSGFGSPFRPLLYSSTVFCINMFFSMFHIWGRGPYADWTWMLFGAASELRVRFRSSKTGSRSVSRPHSPPPPPPPPPPDTHTHTPHHCLWFSYWPFQGAVPLLQFSFVRWWFHMFVIICSSSLFL